MPRLPADGPQEMLSLGGGYLKKETWVRAETTFRIEINNLIYYNKHPEICLDAGSVVILAKNIAKFDNGAKQAGTPSPVKPQRSRAQAISTYRPSRPQSMPPRRQEKANAMAAKSWRPNSIG